MRQLIFIFALIFFVISCDEENETLLSSELLNQEEYIVSEDFAFQIAENLDWNKYSSTTSANYKSSTKRIKKVSEFKSFRDEKTNLGNLLYVANYSDNSFVLISGDKRLAPVLAFSEEGSFPLNTNTLPGGLIDWLNEAERNIVMARSKNLEQSIETKLEWEYIISPKRVDPIGNGCPDGWFITKNPLLATVWGQWHGYNNFAPDHGCSSVNGNVPSGCVATAMSQIMRYHEHPTNYNYAIMPNTRNFASPPWNSAGFNEISQLMLDAANSVDMDWSCDGSSASTSDAKTALINDFGYSDAQYVDYNSSKFKAEIDRNRPVILRGATENCFLGIFCWGEDGHAWVADGYKDSYTCVEDDNGECLGCWGRFWLHMNWGWNNVRLNGWFTDFRVGDNDYTYNKEMIYKITP